MSFDILTPFSRNNLITVSENFDLTDSKTLASFNHFRSADSALNEIEAMSQYPTLTAMGIKSTQDVEKYTLRHESETDVLKIYYKRPKGSFLPKSKKFSFLRGKRSVPVEVRNTKAFDTIQKVSPQLALAIEELEQIKAQQIQLASTDPKIQLKEHLEHLEKVVNQKLNEMADTVRKL